MATAARHPTFCHAMSSRTLYQHYQGRATAVNAIKYFAILP